MRSHTEPGRRGWARPAAVAVALALAVAGLVANPAASPPARAQVARPNIVLILTDDQRIDQLDRMPILQSELVAHGTSFANGFVVDSYCCPSRTTILRGQYSHTTRIYGTGAPYGGYGLFKSLGLEKSTVALWLKNAGYRTGLFGKYLNGYSNTTVVPPGWSDWKGMAGIGSGERYFYNYKLNDNGHGVQYGSAADDYSVDVTGDYAESFIRSTPASQPLFVYYAPTAPHYPSLPAPRHATAASCATAVNTGYIAGHSGLPPSFGENDVSDKPAWVRAQPLLGTSRRTQLASNWRLMCRSLLSVDEAIGGIVDALRDTGRLNNTLIVFTSDNGHLHGEHRVNAKKAFYEESIRVPMIVRFDAMTGGTPRVDTRMALNVDLTATFLDAADVTPGVPQEGKSLLPLLAGGSTSWRDGFLVEHADVVPSSFDKGYVPTFCAVRTSRWVYGVLGTGEKELYDLNADPYEQTNILRPGAVLTAEQTAARTQMFDRLFRGYGGAPALCAPTPPNYHAPASP
jgi:arylsulfatase A-like enzyme